MNEHLIENVRVRQEHVNKIFSGKLDFQPAAVLVNANLKGYCRVYLDQSSLVFFLANLSKIKNTLNRTYLYRVLFDQIKMRNLKPNEYLECIFTHLVVEENLIIIP